MRRDQRYRFLINDNPARLEVHDLDNEQTGPSECQIDEIVSYRYIVDTSINGLANWLRQNPQYDGCAYCLPTYNTG
ncbi:MAG: hypothetical protein HW400_620 [Candidatus Levybacteria bacterium]|nr:hypothetical protein [Candidatus Levybacteria bacterium]